MKLDVTNDNVVRHEERAELMRNFIRRIEERRAEILSILLRISDRQAAEYEIDAALATLRGAEQEIRRYRPPGITDISVFLPSNVLLYSWVLYLAVPLLYSRQVDVRAASVVKDEARQLHLILTEGLDVPVVWHELSQRDFVDTVVLGSSVVVFTGTYQNAEDIRHRLNPEQTMLFLGSGINPFVVGAKADIGRAVSELVAIRCLNSGQDCLAPDVVWVHTDVETEFIRTLVEHVRSLRLSPARGLTENGYGRIHYADALGATASFLFKHRNKIIHGGKVDFRTQTIHPTVLHWDGACRKVAMTEFFAPVFNIGVYRDEHSLADLLTSGRFAESAMGASVFGCSENLFSRLQELHTVTRDESLLAADDGNAPLGGRGPMANYVWHDGRLHIRPILISAVLGDLARDATEPEGAPRKRPPKLRMGVAA